MKFLRSPFLEALGIFGGMVIGSGMFALPYAVSVSGFWASVVAIALAFFAVLSVHLAYGEIVANTFETHRLPGYTKFYLGKLAGNMAKLTQILSFNAILLAYGVLGGIFLYSIFGFVSPFWWTVIFFILGSLIFLIGSIEKIGFINFILTIPLVIAILVISFLAWRGGNILNLSFINSDPFFAFGVFVFSLTGLSVIADAHDIFKKSDSSLKLRKVIILGTSAPLVLYVVFIAAVLFATGTNVSKDAVSGLFAVIGSGVGILGAVIGLLAIFTSYLALGYDLKKIYELDVHLNKFFSWILSACIPLMFFISGAEDFVKIISIVGGVLIALDSFWVILILRKMRSGENYQHRFLSFGKFYQFALIAVFLLSIIYEFVYHIL